MTDVPDKFAQESANLLDLFEWIESSLDDWNEAEVPPSKIDEWRYETLLNASVAADQIVVTADGLMKMLEERNGWSEADIDRITEGPSWPHLVARAQRADAEERAKLKAQLRVIQGMN